MAIIAGLLVALYRADAIRGLGPTWDGVVVGSSSPQDVIETYGIPDRAFLGLQGLEYHYYHDDNDRERWRPATRIVFRGNRVVLIDFDLSRARESELTFSFFLDQFGPPDYISWYRKGLPEYPDIDVVVRLVVFLNDGVLLEVDRGGSIEDTIVNRALFFRPCSLLCVQMLYPYFSPVPPMEDVFPLDPWGLLETETE